MEEDLLFRNKFVKDEELEDVPRELALEFKKWYIKKQTEKVREKIVEDLEQDIDPNVDAGDLLNTNAFKGSGSSAASLAIPQFVPREFMPFDQATAGTLQKGAMRKGIQSGSNDTNIRSTGVKRLRRTIVNIDSRDRDIEEFPDANSFRIFLDRVFLNVKSVELITTEFPNAEQPVKSTPASIQNSKVVWINEEDRDFALTPTFPRYTANLQPGNYTASTLTDEMTLKMNCIKRSTATGVQTGKNHFFDISIDLDTDIVEIHQLELVNLTNNPINTTQNDQTITVFQLNHPFSIGDKAFLTGVKGFVGGISPNELNGFHTVTATTANVGNGSFGPIVINELNNILDFSEDANTTVRVASVAKQIYANPTALATAVQTAMNDSANTNVSVDFGITFPNSFTINTESNVALLWDSGTNKSISIGPTLGFDTTSDDGPNTTFTADLVLPNSAFQFELKVDGVFTDVAGGNGVRSGSLLPFKFLFGTDLNTIGPLLGYPAEDSSEDITTPDTNQLTTFANTIVSASIVTLPFTGVNINSPSHGLVTGDFVQIRNLVTVPRLAAGISISEFGLPNVFEVTVTDGDNFVFPFASVVSVNTTISDDPNWGSSKLNVNHGTHGLSTGDTIRLYRAVKVGGIAGLEINNKEFTVTVVDADNYSVATKAFATTATTGGGSLLRVSSFNDSPATLHGFNGLQDNTSDGTFLNTAIDLGGEDYIFLTSPQLGTISNSNKRVPNIFAKILLTGVPSTRLYNTFLAQPFTPDEPIPRLETLDFELKRQDNNFFSLLGLDYSFSLIISEEIDEITNTSFSSRRGVREIQNQTRGFVRNEENTQNGMSF